MKFSFKQWLKETEEPQTLVFAFGRMNPPTRGHIMHIMEIREYAKRHGVPYMIYASKTQDKKKNPVSPEMKIQYIEKALPGVAIKVAMNMFSIVAELGEQHHFSKLVYFAGGDYFEDQGEQGMMTRLQQEAQKLGMDLQVMSSGNRSEGISGTALRTAAINDDFETFLKASPIGIGHITEEDVRQMFTAVQQGLSKV